MLVGGGRGTPARDRAAEQACRSASRARPANARGARERREIGVADLRNHDVLAVLCRADDVLVPLLMAVVRAGSELVGAACRGTGIDAISRHCAARIESRLGRPPRAHDDWGVELPAGCSCELGRTLAAFLADPTERVLELPLAEQRRRHVHALIDAAEARGPPPDLAVRAGPTPWCSPERLTSSSATQRCAASMRSDLDWLGAWGITRPRSYARYRG